MLFWETRKTLFGRFAVTALLIILAANAALSLHRVSEAEKTELGGPAFLASLYADYLEDPTEVDEYYKELVEYRRSHAKEVREAAAGRGDYVETREARWTGGLYTDDVTVITAMRSFIQKQKDFPTEIEKIIENTEKNRRSLLNSGYDEDSYEYRYQEQAAELYRPVLENVRLSGNYAEGWEIFYTFSIPGILSVLASLIIGSAAFIPDRESGMLPVVRAAKKGRFSTGMSKTVSVLLASVVFSVLLTAETYFIFKATGMLTCPDEPLSALETFRKTWLTTSVSGYLPVLLIQRSLAAAAAVSVSALLSVVFYNYVISFPVSAAAAGVAYALYTAAATPMSEYPVFSFYSLAEGTVLFRRFNALNLFGSPVLFSSVCFALFGAASLLLCAASVAVFVGRSPSSRRFSLAPLVEKIKKRLSGILPARRLRHTLSPSATELYKTFAYRFAGIAAVAALAAGLVLFQSSDAFNDGRRYSEKLFGDVFLAEYAGEWTEEKHEEIHLRLSAAEEIIQQYALKSRDYENGKITREEFSVIQEEYSKANLELRALEKLAARSDYLKAQSEEKGVTGSFFDTRGWEFFFGRSPDFWLFAAIVILSSGIFPVEYGQRRFADLLRSTKKGRMTVFASKLLSAVVCASILTVISEAVMLVTASSRLPMKFLSAPALSIESLSSLDTGITVGWYLVLIIVTRIAAAVILAVATSAFSSLTRSQIAAAVASAGLFLIPSLAEKGGAAWLSRADFLRVFEGGRLLSWSISLKSLPDFSGAAAICVVLLLGAALLTGVSCMRFIRKA
ncbi:MAG: hypothetical protein ILO42_03240 [Clostridia bacterium]|nr:hypothetical protein [Clostridia bacterium]